MVGILVEGVPMSEKSVPGSLMLEETLAEVRQAIAECFSAARSIPLAADEYGHHRAREYQNAVELLKMSAEVGLALARLKGEFNQNINVVRSEAPAKRAGRGGGLS